MANVVYEGFRRLTDPNYVPDLTTPDLVVAAPVELPTFEQLVASGLLRPGRSSPRSTPTDRRSLR